MLPTCQRHGIGVLVWSPLSGGWLTGKYRAAGDAPDGLPGGDQPRPLRRRTTKPRLRRSIACAPSPTQAGLPLAHLALAWAAEHPAVSSVLLGPRTEDQLAELLGAADVELDADMLDAIDDDRRPGHRPQPRRRRLDPAGPRTGRPPALTACSAHRPGGTRVESGVVEQSLARRLRFIAEGTDVDRQAAPILDDDPAARHDVA